MRRVVDVRTTKRADHSNATCGPASRKGRSRAAEIAHDRFRRSGPVLPSFFERSGEWEPGSTSVKVAHDSEPA